MGFDTHTVKPLPRTLCSFMDSLDLPSTSNFRHYPRPFFVCKGCAELINMQHFACCVTPPHNLILICGEPSLACSLIPIRLPTGTVFSVICRQTGFNVFSLTSAQTIDHLQADSKIMSGLLSLSLIFSQPSEWWYFHRGSLTWRAFPITDSIGLRYKPGVPQFIPWFPI